VSAKTLVARTFLVGRVARCLVANGCTYTWVSSTLDSNQSGGFFHCCWLRSEFNRSARAFVTHIRDDH
jgi:hypothetical protein